MTRDQVARLIAWVLIAMTVVVAIIATVGFWRLQENIVRLRQEAAALESNRAVTLTGLSDLQAVLIQKVETPNQTCDKVKRARDILLTLTSAQREAIPTEVYSILANACSVMPGGIASPEHQATRDFVTTYIDALGARLQADYPKSQALYENALAIPHADEVDAQWRMRALEGVAYAQMKRGRYDPAAKSLAQLEALRLAENQRLNTDFEFVFAGLDEIKLACVAKRADAAQIRRDLDALRARFDHYAATRPDAWHAKYARLDRGYIEQDAELFELCAAAGVTLKPLPAPAP